MDHYLCPGKIGESRMFRLIWIVAVLSVSPLHAFAHSPQIPYTGQETRALKTLSDEKMQALLSGQGMGLARSA
jgi:hypothetical protein